MEEVKRKRGRPKKVEVIENGVQEERQEGQEVVETVQESKPEPSRFVEKPPQSDADRIAESRQLLNEPLGPNQRYFESPEGEIFLGPVDKDQIWSRHMNKGHGGWVNPRR